MKIQQLPMTPEALEYFREKLGLNRETPLKSKFEASFQFRKPYSIEDHKKDALKRGVTEEILQEAREELKKEDEEKNIT